MRRTCTSGAAVDAALLHGMTKGPVFPKLGAGPATAADGTVRTVSGTGAARTVVSVVASSPGAAAVWGETLAVFAGRLDGATLLKAGT